jgi:UDP-N-acetyl-D-glucosamine dehydrogenase
MNFMDQIKSRNAKIGIYGLGYVGLPLALRFCEEGFEVTGFDIDERKIVSLGKGESYIETIPTSRVRPFANNLLRATTDFSKTRDMDALIICVPTPLNKYREPDLAFVEDTVNAILPYARANQLISLESTSYPGTTKEVIGQALEKKGFKIGENYFVIYSPEREDPGRLDFHTKTTPKVCGGMTSKCLELGVSLYSAVIDKVVPVSSTEAAEMTKLLENIHRSVNIGLVNEMKIVADKMNLDIFEIIEAAATKPFGFVPYFPGPGIGGHCIPIDPFYLTWKAREYGVHTRFIELAGEINSSMPEYVIAKLMDALNERTKPLKGSKVLLLGMAYKKNVSDTRESPSLEVFHLLLDKGATVDYSDPHAPTIGNLRNYPDLRHSSVSITETSLAQYDAVILLTNHDKFDKRLIGKHAKLIIDTRGAFDRAAANVVRA